MRLDPDFSELLALRAHEARFLVVGGYAVALHRHPRYMGDLDVWILIDEGNARSVLAALDEFSFGGVGLTVEDFMRPDHVVQLGYPPLRVDLLTSIDGVDFAEAYELQADYDLAVYDEDDELVAATTERGTQSKQLRLDFEAGRYYALVSGHEGAYGSPPYEPRHPGDRRTTGQPRSRIRPRRCGCAAAHGGRTGFRTTWPPHGCIPLTGR